LFRKAFRRFRNPKQEKMRMTYRLLKTWLVVWLLWPVVANAVPADRRFVLVIDAGHGGHDSGAVGAFSKEKNINLSVALEFGRLVEASCPDVKVVYTRKKDVFIPLQTRADIANRHKADLFISIHTNALPNGRIAYGSETYTLGMARAAANLEVAKRENAVITFEANYRQTYEGFDPNKAESYIIFEFMQDRYMKQSVDLAGCIQKEYVKRGRRNKGVHQAGFLVLRKTSMPAVLTELGFITTPEEERYLNSAEGIKNLGRSIFEGFVEYRRQHDRLAVLLPPPDGTAAPSAETAPPPAAAPVPSAASTPPAETSVDAAPAQAAPAQTEEPADRPVFKVQLFVCDRRLKAGDARFKGLAPVDCYADGGLVKYTYGASEDYNAVRKMQRSIADKFPQAFIVAFIGGRRTDLQEALRMYRRNK